MPLTSGTGTIFYFQSVSADEYKARSPNYANLTCYIGYIGSSLIDVDVCLSTCTELGSSIRSLIQQILCSIYTIDQPLSPLDQPPIHSDCPNELLITESDVFRYLASIDCSKATGPDLISGTMLKNTATAITPIVTALFNLSIKTCTFPNCWKISNVSPIRIPKGGDIKNPSNYRPVSLLSILSKVFERHIFSLISDSVAISENQWGFQPGKSTSSAVLSALYSWEALLDRGQEVLVTFLDIKKAFDSVPHRRLLSKLRDLHIPEQIVALINSYLCDRSQQVCVNGTSSAKCHVSSGVPWQGSVLGLLLFNAIYR